MIIDETYFEGLIALDTSKPAKVETLEYYISFYEDKFMQKLLGEFLYNDYLITPAKYTALINGGGTFVYNGITYKYTGLKQMFAQFVYFYAAQDEKSFQSVRGAMTANMENSESVFDPQKLINAWNEGVRLYEIAVKYLAANSATYAGCSSETINKINSFGL